MQTRRAEMQPHTSSKTPSVVDDLRRVLDDVHTRHGLESAAQTLGVSTRVLQRRLHAEGTTFQHEIAFVRVRAAQRMMVETDMPLTRIALEAGFSSLARLGNVFRRIEGTSPSAWRKEHAFGAGGHARR